MDVEISETIDLVTTEQSAEPKNDSNKSLTTKRKNSDSEAVSAESVITKDEESIQKSPVKNDTTTDSISIPPIETLGKGKRARIPNKRYGDILITSAPRLKTIENGDKNHEKVESENDEDDSIRSSPASKKAKVGVDVTDPKFRKPFPLGWKREIVFRASSDNGNKQMGDIYYITPDGKKLRSLREISEHVKDTELSVENFTFCKELLGLNDPELEIIRDARVMSKRIVSKGGGMKSPKLASPRAATPKTTSPKAGATKNLQMKLPPAKTKSDRRATNLDEEIELEPSAAKRSSSTKKAPSKAVTKSVDASRSKRRSIKTNNIPLNEKTKETVKFMDSYVQNLSYGYNTLLNVFQYLKVQDLLRAGCVCTMWRDIASHPSLWRTVRMKNSQVHSFEGLANTLQKHGTIHLDLRKMLLPTSGTAGDDIWLEFSKVIERVQTLKKIELCRCPASVVDKLAITNKNLEVLNAVTIKCESMSFEMLAAVKDLKELRLKSTSGLNLPSDITALKELKNLAHLSLTSIKDLDKMDLKVIAGLTKLESLDLGECTDFPETFGEQTLIKLKKLEKLRLEKGQGNCHTFEILEAVRAMPQLEQLELVNFDIKTGFDFALGGCSNIRKLLIIPTYISQSATTNHMVLGGVLRLQSTLSHFVWGVTLELLRVTELFVDQCEDNAKKEKKEKNNGDSIPVLKPIPLLSDKHESIAPVQDPPQVEILPLPNLQKLLLQSLPTTRVKILKIPFHATWRQSITDTVN